MGATPRRLGMLAEAQTAANQQHGFWDGPEDLGASSVIPGVGSQVYIKAGLRAGLALGSFLWAWPREGVQSLFAE